MRTPPNLVQDHNIPEWCASRKLWRAWKAYNGPFRSQILSTLTALQHSGAMAQIGDAPKKVDRITQDDIAAMLGRTRPTVTRRISMIASPDPHWTDYCDLRDRESYLLHPEESVMQGEARRRRHSENMRERIKGHPHWHHGDCEHKESKHDRRIRRHIACFITRNKAFACASSYAAAMPADKFPQIASRQDPAHEAGILFEQFGESFNPNTYKELGVPTNGYDMSVGFNWHPNLPLLVKCSCRMGQGKFDFQKVCPHCGDKGFVQAGAMPDIGRYFYQTLIDLGLKKRITRCGDCNRVWDQRRTNCPSCGGPGQVVKEAGVLEGWTQEAIGKLIGAHVSTIRKYEHAYGYLMLIRTVPGRVWKRCSKCEKEFSGRCACGNTGGVVTRRDPHKYLDLTDRTLYQDLANAEKERINAILCLHRRWLDKRQQESLEQAAELAINVLGEWTNREHKLESFYREMRRRMLANAQLARFANVLFPIHRE